jgi:RND family efflux transporter MFP subunit
MMSINNRLLIRLLATSLFLVSGCSGDQDEAGKTGADLPVADVTTITVQKQSPIRQVELMGTVQAADSAEIAARISGTITDLPVTPGSRVKKGDPLITISAGEITAKLLQAQAQYEQAARNLKRERNLLKKNAATPENVKTLEESKRIAEAAYKEARTMLSYTEVKAPFDGIITRKMANVGDLATPGKPLVRIDNESRLQVLTDVPETLILGISLGDTLEVYIPAAEAKVSGTVEEIAPTADPRSRTAPVKLSVEPTLNIRSGQFARVSLPSTRGSAVMVPAQAVQSYGQMDKVFIVRDGKAQLLLVKTGLSSADQVEILSGLNEGDEVIITGHTHLKDGQPISKK